MDPNKFWKWRIVYVNRENPDVFVPKRYGIGYTLNFGNRWSWGVLALILFAIALPFAALVLIIEALRGHFSHYAR
jgi:uncharacterized membrane protein